MMLRFSHFLDTASDFVAVRKGLLPLLAIVLILINAILQFLPLAPLAAWLARTNLLLHIGLILAILGMMLAWAL